MTKSRPFTPRAEEFAAILAGRQTQFRRPIKPQPMHCPVKGIDGRWYHINYKREPVVAAGEISNPFGKPGDLLWVKEAHWIDPYPDGVLVDSKSGCVHYKMNHPYPGIANDIGQKGLWRPAITMPRWASRHVLCVLDVRWEQVQNISNDDCIESIAGTGLEDVYSVAGNFLYKTYTDSRYDYLWKRWRQSGIDFSDMDSFQTQWDAAHAAKGFAFGSNPWTWVVKVEVVK